MGGGLSLLCTPQPARLLSLSPFHHRELSSRIPLQTPGTPGQASRAHTPPDGCAALLGRVPAQAEAKEVRCLGPELDPQRPAEGRAPRLLTWRSQSVPAGGQRAPAARGVAGWLSLNRESHTWG